jgi:hypothetical protein
LELVVIIIEIDTLREEAEEDQCRVRDIHNLGLKILRLGKSLD